MELADVIPIDETGLTVRTARVISIAGRVLTVDLGGPVNVRSLDSCNPVPNQHVYIVSDGSSMTAIGAIGGPARQSTLTATSNATTSVTGVLNGVSTAVVKFGTFTATAGDVLPLVWSADGSRVWVGEKEGAATAPPDPGGGSGGSPGGVTSGSSTYPATYSGSLINGVWRSGPVDGQRNGAYFYGAGRFRELQGRTILGGRISIPGQGSGTMYCHGLAGPTGTPTHTFTVGSVVPTSGWRNLSVAALSNLVNGDGTGGITFSGSIGLNPLPAGTLQIDWRR